MVYKLIVTEHADELIDNLVGYLIKNSKIRMPPFVLWMDWKVFMNGLKKVQCSFRKVRIIF